MGAALLPTLFCIIATIAVSGCIAIQDMNIGIPATLPDFNKLQMGESNAGKVLETDGLDKNFPQQGDGNKFTAEDLNAIQQDKNAGTARKGPQIDLRINTQIFYPYEGEAFIVPGRFKYSDRKFILQFDRVVEKGFNLYEARFNLYDLNWNLIDYTVIPEQQEVEFHDEDGNLIQLGAFIYFAYVMMPPS